MGQTIAFKNEGVRKALGMPPMPKVMVEDTSESKPTPNPLKFVSDFINKEQAQSEHATAEIVDGTAAPPPPPGTPSNTPIPTTYVSKPKGKKGGKKGGKK